MHIRHHDVEFHGKGGLFGTAYWPPGAERPARLGLAGMDDYPDGLVGRLRYPVVRLPRPARDRP